MRDKSILLVEDTASDEALTLMALRNAGIANVVEVVRDGAAALERLTSANDPRGEPQELPQVVLLDLGLPKIGGLDVLRALRANERTRLQPVVVLTSSAEDADIVGSYELGANSFVRKPVEFDTFVAAVQQLGLYWLLLNKRAPA